MTLNKLAIIALILGVALIVSVGYIGYGKLQQNRVLLYNQGINDGVTGAVATLFQQTEDCQVTNILLENQTRYIVDAECFGKIKNSSG